MLSSMSSLWFQTVSRLQNERIDGGTCLGVEGRSCLLSLNSEMAFIAGFDCLRARREMEVDRRTEIAVQSIAIQEDIPFDSFEAVSLAWINVTPAHQKVTEVLVYSQTSSHTEYYCEQLHSPIST